MIVTNADLVVCRFSPRDVELGTGMLPQGSFDSVPFLRFEKSLLSASQLRSDYMDIPALNRLSIATVFVVNASAFEEFLSVCMLQGDPNRASNPWVRLRNQNV